jgi:hypothetical protein
MMIYAFGVMDLTGVASIEESWLCPKKKKQKVVFRMS